MCKISNYEVVNRTKEKERIDAGDTVTDNVKLQSQVKLHWDFKLQLRVKLLLENIDTEDMKRVGG